MILGDNLLVLRKTSLDQTGNQPYIAGYKKDLILGNRNLYLLITANNSEKLIKSFARDD